MTNIYIYLFYHLYQNIEIINENINNICNSNHNMTTVISIRQHNLKKLGYKNLEDWLKNENHIYIGRDMTYRISSAIGSKWCNPFSVKKYKREECIDMFRQYILLNKELLSSLSELKDKILGCWCKPEACHGDVLIELIKLYT